MTKVKLKKKIIRKSSMLGGEVEVGGYNGVISPLFYFFTFFSLSSFFP